MRRIAFSTLGCKLNQYETDSLATQFARAGYAVVDSGEPADIYVVNTCTVTNRADRKSRNALFRVLRQSRDCRPPGVVVALGCYTKEHRAELAAAGVDLILDNARKPELFGLLHARLQPAAATVSATAGAEAAALSLPPDVFAYPNPDPIFHTRGMVKIQDGCDNVCSFCIIPRVRGRAVSRPPEQVVDSVRALCDQGYQEIVLTGVNMSRYQRDDLDFVGLVERVLAVDRPFRLRISSLEPDGLSERFVNLFEHPKACNHLHLCLQSASDRVLVRMRRRYSYAQYTAIAHQLKTRFANFNLTTDTIAGFPGETPDDVEATRAAIREIGFGHVHVFPYSLRSGTAAAGFADHVAETEKLRRAAVLRTTAAAAAAAYRRNLIGITQRLLVETVDPDARAGHWLCGGLGEHYVAIRSVVATAPPFSANSPTDRFGANATAKPMFGRELIPVRITGVAAGGELIAVPTADYGRQMVC